MKKTLLLLPLMLLASCGNPTAEPASSFVASSNAASSESSALPPSTLSSSTPQSSSVSLSSSSKEVTVYSLSAEEIEVLETGNEPLPTIYQNGVEYQGKVTWSVDDEDIAEIHAGLIYGIAPGETVIRAKIDAETTLICSVSVLSLVRTLFTVRGTPTKDVEGHDAYMFAGASYRNYEAVGVYDYTFYENTYVWKILYTPETDLFRIQCNWNFIRDGHAGVAQGVIVFEWGDYQNGVFQSLYKLQINDETEAMMAVQFDNSCITFISSSQNIGITERYVYRVLHNDWDSVDSYDLALLWHAIREGHNQVRDLFDSDPQAGGFGLKLF